MYRRILLVEPPYSAKYPPLGLMKISSYHKQLGDEVKFFRGSILEFVRKELLDKLIPRLIEMEGAQWGRETELVERYIRNGHLVDLDSIKSKAKSDDAVAIVGIYRDYYRERRFWDAIKRWDRVYVTTLMTFQWNITIKTINDFKAVLKPEGRLVVGGIAATAIPDAIEEETGIKPITGILDKPGMLDDNDLIADDMPLDYSICTEIETKYAEGRAYYGYTTRGCVNHCGFCLVPKLEPHYVPYYDIKAKVTEARKMVGDRPELILWDNNVLASPRFDDIVEDIKALGFTAGAKMELRNEYEEAIGGLQSGYNDQGYIREVVRQYHRLVDDCRGKRKEFVLRKLNKYNLLSEYTATKGNILKMHPVMSGIFAGCRKFKPKIVARKVDFNQSLDARLFTEERAKKMAETSILPMRLSFNSWALRDQFEQAVRNSVKYGMRVIDVLFLYNYHDTPLEFWKRIRLDLKLQEELGGEFSMFPMRYQPIADLEYVKNREYIGEHWNRKFLRAVTRMTMSSRGAIVGQRSYFDHCWGSTEDEFMKRMYMPVALLKPMNYYEDLGITNAWLSSFNALNSEKKEVCKRFVEANDFHDITSLTHDEDILEVLRYYTIPHDKALTKEELRERGFL